MPRTSIVNFGRVLVLAAVSILLSLVTLAPVGAVTLAQDCTNPDYGYTVAFPAGWYVNEHVDGGELDDVAACRFFSPQDFEVRPQSGIAGVAIAIGGERNGPPGALTPDTTVGGKPAFVTESTTEEDGLEPAGTRHYDYWIEIGPDSWLVAGTSDSPTSVGDYEDNKAILDAMMDDLTFAVPKLPDTAVPR